MTAQAAQASATTRGRGPLPPVRRGLEFFGDLSSPNTSIVSGAVATLGDSSGKGRHFTQATASKRPAYLASDPSLGGKPSMTFDGVDDGLLASTFLAGTTQTIYIVTRGGTTGRLYDGGSINNVVVSEKVVGGITGAYYNTAFTRKGTFYTPVTKPVRLAFTVDPAVGASSVPTMYLDGTTTGTYSVTNAINGTIVTAPQGIGSDAGAFASFFNGTLAAVLIYSGLHTAAEITQIDAWLAWRYKLSTVMPPLQHGLELFTDITSPDTSISGGAVATLGDRSGNARHFIQSTAGNRPTYNATDVVFGRPSMTLDGINDCLNWVAGLPAMANITIYMVTRAVATVGVVQRMFVIAPAAAAGGLLIGTPIAANFQARFDSAPGFANASIRGINVVLASVNRSAFIGALTAGGALWTTYLNGLASGGDGVTAAGTGVSSAATGQTTIGAESGGGSSFTSMVMADLLVYSRAHSNAEVLIMDAWLAQRNNMLPPLTDGLEFFGDLTSPDTIIIDGLVSQLGDRSGNARHAGQGTSTKRPVFTAADATVNGRPSMTFDGSDDGIITPSFAASTGNKCTIYVTFRTSTLSVFMALLSQAIGGTANVTALAVGAASVDGYFVNPAGAYTFKQTTARATAYYQAAIVVDAALGATTPITAYLNGVAGGSYGGVAASNGGPLVASAWGIGSNPSASASFFNGKILDSLIYSREHTAAEVAIMNAWLFERAKLNTPPITEGLEFFGDLSSPNTSIVSSAVAVLGDSSGKGRHFVQATAGNRPAYAAANANFGNRPSMTFDGVDDFLALTFAWPGSVATVYIVFRTTSVALSDQRVFGVRIGVTANNFRFALNSTSTGFTVANPVGSETLKGYSPIAANTSYRFAGLANLAGAGTAAVPTTYLDGVAGGTYTTSTAVASGPFASAAHAIGATDLGTGPFSGTITDILVFSKTHTAAEVALIDAWLKARNSL